MAYSPTRSQCGQLASIPLIGVLIFLSLACFAGCGGDSSDEAEQVLVRRSDGSAAYYVPAGDGSGTLIPVEPPEGSRRWTSFAIGLFVFGLIGQAMFMGRFALQWIVSERAKRSVVPVGFWWFSLIGSSILITYFALRLEPIGILGQCLGWPIYARNLYMIKRRRRDGVESATDPAEHPVPDPNAEM